jgi:hypothetical protein
MHSLILISDRLRKIAELIELEKKIPENNEKDDNLPSAPKIKPKRRISPDNKVMAPGTFEGKQQRKDYQSEYRADGKDLNSRYVKKPNFA